MYSIIIASSDNTIYVNLFDEDNHLLECYPFAPNLDSDVGNIYVGIIKNKIKGVGGYFVDYGHKKNGFLSIKDGGNKLSIGQFLMVQIRKDSYEEKGAKLSTHIQIAGDYMVLIDDTSDMLFSSKLPEDSRTKSIKAMLKKIKREELGIIVRTLAYNTNNQLLKDELIALTQEYEKITKDFPFRPPYSKLYSRGKTWMDKVHEMNKRYDSKIILDADLEEEWSSLHNSITVNYVKNLFYQVDLEAKIKKGIQRKQWLSSGGSIIIDKTEAMTVIDVNSGKNARKSTERRNTLRINKEAAKASLKYIRLANISGIIIIDFIDMAEDDDREELIKYTQSLALQDFIKVTIHDITVLGLMEITRKRTEISLLDKLSKL